MAQIHRSAAERAQEDVTVDTLKSEISSLATTVKKLAADQLGTAAEEVQDKASQKAGELEAAIRKNPTQSALISAGVGFLLGLVLTR